MRFAFLLLSWILGSVPPALAGAWLQSEGSAFLSLENKLRQRGDVNRIETDIYFEYGVSPRLSAGVSILQEGWQTGHIGLFLKTPLAAKNTSFAVSARADIGAYVSGRQWFGLSKLTFSYGRGFPWGDGYGWLNVDTAIEYRRGETAPFLKLDGTIGRSSGARLRPILKLSFTHIEGEPLIWSVAPGLLLDAGPNLTWTLGLERKQDGRSSNALTLGLWRRF